MTCYIVHGGTLKGRIENIECLQRAEELAFEYGAEVWLEGFGMVARMRSI